MVGCTKVSDKEVLKNAVGITQIAKPVQAGDLTKADASVLLIDARTPAAYAQGHIPGARNIRLPQIDAKEKDPALDRYKIIYVYDQHRGAPSGMAVAKRLLTAKYSDVRLFDEGFDAWRAAGLPIERSAAPPSQ